MRGAAVFGAFLGLLTLAADATAQGYRDDRGSQSSSWGGGYGYDGRYGARRYGERRRFRYGYYPYRYGDRYRGRRRYGGRRYYGSRNRYRRHYGGRRYAYGRDGTYQRRDTDYRREPEWRRDDRRFPGAPRWQPQWRPERRAWHGYRVWREVEPAR